MKRKYPVAIKGGNWKGKDYLTYVEHDQCKRATFGHGSKEKKREAYNQAANHIIESR